MDVELLLIGFNTGVLNALDQIGMTGVVVLEEPDLWRNKGLKVKASLHPCLADVRLATYQQAKGYLAEVGEIRGRTRAVAAGLEYAVPAAAHIAELLGLPGAGCEAARTLRDKIELRRTLIGSGLREVNHCEVFSAQDIKAFLAKHGSAVLKPANRQASLGVRVLGPDDDVEAAWSACLEADEGTQLATRDMHWRYTVEQRLTGKEVSVEALVRDGDVLWTNLTRKTTLTGLAPVEIGHVVGFPQEIWTKRMQHFVDAIGFQTGILHSEWMVRGNVAVVVECAGRPPGDHIADLIDLAYDDNLCARWIRLMQGEQDDPPMSIVRGAAVRFLVAREKGTLVEVSGVEEARARPGIESVDVTDVVGCSVGPATSSWDRLGFVIATGANAEQASARALEATERIQLRIEDETAPTSAHSDLPRGSLTP